MPNERQLYLHCILCLCSIVPDSTDHMAAKKNWGHFYIYLFLKCQIHKVLIAVLVFYLIILTFQSVLG